jgi:hypothetical protein
MIGLVMLPAAIMLSVAGPVARRHRALILWTLSGEHDRHGWLISHGDADFATDWTRYGDGELPGDQQRIASCHFESPGARCQHLSHDFLLGGAFGTTMITSVIDFREGAGNALNLLHSGAGVEFSDAFLVPLTICGIPLVLTLIPYVPKPSEVD